MKTKRILRTVIGLVSILVVSMALIGCNDDKNPLSSGGGGGEPLTSFEQALVGGWSRYHSYDGSRQYFIFNDDRTACYWERSSSGGLVKNRHYGYWKLEGSGTTFTLRRGSSSSDLPFHDTFDYASDKVYYGGYGRLSMARDNSLSGCP